MCVLTRLQKFAVQLLTCVTQWSRLTRYHLCAVEFDFTDTHWPVAFHICCCYRGIQYKFCHFLCISVLLKFVFHCVVPSPVRAGVKITALMKKQVTVLQ